MTSLDPAPPSGAGSFTTGEPEDDGSRTRRKILLIILIVLFLVALGVLLYTVFSDSSDSGSDKVVSIEPNGSNDSNGSGDGSGTGSGNDSGTGNTGDGTGNGEGSGSGSGGSLSGALIASGSGRVSDGEGVWRTERTYAIFDNALFGNSKIVAPGTDNIYHFKLENLANYAFTYKVIIETFNDEEVPIDIRLMSNGTYLLGSPAQWIRPGAYHEADGEGKMLPGQSHDLAYDWRWPFEQGVDEHDTTLGNAAIYDIQKYAVKITILTEQDGAVLFPKTGDDTKFLLWIELVVVALLMVAIALVYRRDHSENTTH